jgi:hypothetical protein
MSTLHLTLKKKWYDLIASGEKKEEYRQIKDFWVKRFGSRIEWSMESYIPADISDSNGVGYKIYDFKTVTFKNGYQSNAPTMVVEFKGINIGTAKPEWSDNWQGDVFIIKLGKISI